MIYIISSVAAMVFFVLVIFLEFKGTMASTYEYSLYKKDGRLKKAQSAIAKKKPFMVFTILFLIGVVVCVFLDDNIVIKIAAGVGVLTFLVLLRIPTKRYYKLVDCYHDYEERIQELDILIDGNPFVSFEQLHFSNRSKRFYDETCMIPYYKKIMGNIDEFNVVLADMRKDCLKIKERINLRIKTIDIKSIGKSNVNVDFNDYIDSAHFDKQDRMQQEINRNIVNYRRIFSYVKHVDDQLFANVRPIDRLYEEKDVRHTGILFNYSLYMGFENFKKIYNEYLKIAEAFDREFEKPYMEFDDKIKGFMKQVYQSIMSGRCDLYFEPRKYRLNVTKTLFDAMMTAQKRVDAYCRSIEEDCDKIRNLLRQITFTKKEYNAQQFEFILKLSNDQEISGLVQRFIDLVKKYNELFASQKDIMKGIEEKYTKLIYSGQTVDMIDVKHTISEELKEHLNYRQIEAQIDASYEKLKNIKEDHPNLLFELAIKQDDIVMLDRILEQTKEVSQVDVEGNNLIHFCALNGAYKCYQRLSSFNISQTIGNKIGMSPIDLAQPDNAVYTDILKRTTNNEAQPFSVEPIKPSSVVGKNAFKLCLEGMIKFNRTLAEKNSDDPIIKNRMFTNNNNLKEILDYSIENGGASTKSQFNLKAVDAMYQTPFNAALEYAKDIVRPLDFARKCKGYFQINIDGILRQLAFYVATLDMDGISKIEQAARAVLGMSESQYILEQKYAETLYAEIGLHQNPDYYHRTILYCYSLLIFKRIIDGGGLLNIKEQVDALFKEKAAKLIELYKENPEPEAFKILVEYDPLLEEELDENDKYYKLLGLTKTASLSEIKKAYRKATLAHHKDRGGDGEMIALLNEAYSRLLILGKEK